MTIDPNTTLSGLRAAMGAELRDASHTTDLSRTYRAAQPLLAHLDAGGPLPDVWTPFYTSAKIVWPILPDGDPIAEAQANLESDDDEAIYERRDHVEVLCGALERTRADLAAALQTIEQAASTTLEKEFVAWANDDPEAARRWALKHTATTSEPDPRSIAGELRQALTEWNRLNHETDDGDAFIDAGSSVAESARALLDCQPDEHQPTHLEMAEQLRLTRRGNEQLVQRRQADMDTIDRLTHDLAATEQLVQRIGDQRNTYQQESYDLRDELTSTRSEADELRHRNETQRASVRNVLSSPNLGNAQHDAAYALVARAAAHIADGIEGSARDLRQHATSQIALGGNTGTPDSKQRARTTIAAMLAVGAARHGANRKSSDLAERTAGYLEAIADTLS